MSGPPSDDTLRGTLRRAQAGATPEDREVLQWVIDALDNGWIIGGYVELFPSPFGCYLEVEASP